ncbi:MAG: thiamine phosphate synthase, partial [Gemmataceae bacterium]|nr:thiamine phosphate synthase [Gemmataceae bacterium]
DSPGVPDVRRLFQVARAWSIRFRHDPEFLTDALFLAVLRADQDFQLRAEGLGLHPVRLERLLVGGSETRPAEEEFSAPPPEPSPEALGNPDAAAEIDAARVLDANFNRAREAARVLEDYCRFSLDDAFLTRQVKELRHGLASAAQKLPPDLLLAARETQKDVGTNATSGGEYARSSPAHVAQVNLKRLQESLRSLEEFAKVFGPALGRELEALRYAAYTLERAVLTGGAARERLARAKLYVLLTRARCPAALDWTIREAARGGADVFQLREKALPDRELLELAREVRRWTRETNALFIVNDRPDIARLCEADGVHLGQDDLSVKDARRVLGPGPLIGVSTHSVEQLRQAVLDGADYAGVGPTFPSRTKSFDAFPGLAFVRAAHQESTLPMFVLGGIGPENACEVVAAGARRLAVSSAVCAADDPERSARLLKAALSE